IAARLATGSAEAGAGDVADIRAFLGGEAILAFLDAPWLPLFIAVIWMMHPLLGAIAVTGAILLLAIALVNDRLTRSRLTAAAQRQREAQADARRIAEQAETLAGLGMVGAVIDAWRRRRALAEAEALPPADTAALCQTLSRLVRLAVQVAILGAGAWLVLQSALTAGGMIAASIILSRALSPVERAIGAWRSWGSFRAARARLDALFGAADAGADRMALPRPEGRLAVQDLRFVSSASREPVIKSAAFQLAPGEVCAIIGPSGSGKSSLCRLLVGAWRPTDGSVRLDGAEVSDWEQDALGRHLGYLPQTVDFFGGRVADNIARLGPVDDAAVIRAARLAGAHDMILRLPQGYDTPVGTPAFTLSGGQRQRIALARALYGDPSLIVLDEPSLNLDGNGEMALQDLIRTLKADRRTVVMVTHLPHLLRAADKVLIMTGGAMTRFGPRDDVLREVAAARDVVSERALVRKISSLRQATPIFDRPDAPEGDLGGDVVNL
ncbi:MAG TPA: type I secretion system permease/ATPase, partial [Paracoccaceae bacterium]|nr:type I secretion system permease/ATPase [Paracoccaceae bacterium]